MKRVYSKPVLVSVGVLSRVTANGASVADSDIRLKTNIERIGTTVLGLPLYRFSYIGSGDRFEGVMAQDVLGVMPRAVSRDATGFYSVDYAMLGIDMKRAV